MKELDCGSDLTISELISHLSNIDAGIGFIERITVITEAQKIIFSLEITAIEPMSEYSTMDNQGQSSC